MTTTDTAATLVAAAVTARPGEPVLDVIADWLPVVRRVSWLLRLTSDEELQGYVGGCTTFIAEVEKVTKVWKGEGERGGHKARVYTGLFSKDGEPEYLETGWLGHDLTDLCAEQARSLIGQRALFFKRNRFDESGEVTQGFRELVWISPLDGRRNLGPKQPQNPSDLHRQAAVEEGVDRLTEDAADRSDWTADQMEPF